jgi:hypothetical protein
MMREIKMLDRVVPLWEILIIAAAMAAIVLVLILWWAFGYNLAAVIDKPQTMEALALSAALL